LSLVPLHVTVHDPQCAAVVISVSQPLSGLPSQSANPFAHAAAANEHSPLSHDALPVTLASVVQSWPQRPQFSRSSSGVQAPSHAMVPSGQLHSLHWHVAAQVSVAPVVSQFRESPAAQTPSFAQPVQSESTPSVQVRICFPQLPQGRESSPSQVVGRGGRSVGVGDAVQSPQTGTPCRLVVHSAVTVMVGTCAPRQTPAGKRIVPSFSVQPPLPSSSAIQQGAPLGAQMPFPPAGKVSATFTRPASAFGGAETVHPSGSTGTTSPSCMHSATGKHRSSSLGLGPASVFGRPPLASAGTGAISEGCTFVVSQVPTLHVSWPGHVESPFCSAVPSQR
jgi:hypothetical protein